MELIKGKTLSDFIEQSEGMRIPEEKCQVVIREVMHAIKYFHSKGIVHRDLKPDNIIVLGYDTDDVSDLRIKLIDFGMSKFTKKGNKKINLSTYCGTIDFIAPEVFEGTGYDQSCDIWSIGVIAYFMLSGTPPFLGKDERQIQSNIITCNYSFSHHIWSTISGKAQEWLDGMLELNPQDRFTPDQALDHIWLSSQHSAKNNYMLHPMVLSNLHACHQPHFMHFEMLSLFTQFLDDGDIQAIRETFQNMDEDNTGTIEIDELKQAYESLNKIKESLQTRDPRTEAERIFQNEEWEILSTEKIDEILNKVDQDKNGCIEYSEFLAHCLTGKHLSRDNLLGFFRIMLPLNKTKHERDEASESMNEYITQNTIDAETVKDFFQRSGKVISVEEAKDMMDQCGQACGIEGFDGSS